MQAVEILLEGICKHFVHRVKGEVAAVDDVSLRVEPGELLTILGPSGCGKTTTLRIIAGFERPDRGRVSIAGADVTELLANRRNIGFVFQNYALFPHLSIYENVAYGLKVQGLPGREIDRQVREVLELVGLQGYEHQFPHQISGGEQQRVALARAIVIKPKVLLFDEPLSNLDAKLRVYTRGEIRRLQRRLAITSIYVTHDQEEAMAISDRIVVMNRGRIAQIGTAEQLYFSPASEFVARFIGKVNALPARVVGVSAETLELNILGHTYRVAERVGQARSGQELQAFVRPEVVELLPEPQAGHFPAVVTDRTFLGEKIEYGLKTGRGLKTGEVALTVVSHPLAGGGAFAPEQTVGVRLREDSIRLLKEEQQ